jgi:3'(2'), 5'-bisphosphate nucleotidase
VRWYAALVRDGLPKLVTKLPGGDLEMKQTQSWSRIGRDRVRGSQLGNDQGTRALHHRVDCRKSLIVGNTDRVSPDGTDAALAADLATDAGRLLLGVRDQVGFDYPWLLGDAGDSQANSLLLRRLRLERPGDAVLSEEAYDDLTRLRAERVWIVDPLDGTREFSSPGRDDWAVHVALWQRHGGPNGAVTDAAVALPAMGELYRTDAVSTPTTVHSGSIRITASSNRPPAVLYRLAERLDIEIVRIGSAGAKAMSVVRGDADAYIHAGGQWEWDSAAPAGVIQAAGMHASRLDGSELVYNRPDPYLPDFLMCRAELADVLLGAIRLAS